MVPNSYYKEIAGKLNKKTTNKTSSIAIKNIVDPTHIKLNSPVPDLAGDCYKFNYNITTILNSFQCSVIYCNPEIAIARGF
jgi:hypothetical protein